MIDYTSYVNIKQGTFSEYKCSYGNTLPLVTRPFGMNAFALQTRGSGSGWFYHPTSMQAEGIRLTHQPSPWIGDYGQLIFMPQTGKVIIHEDSRTSSFREIAMDPASLEIYFKRYRAKMCVAPTERCAMITTTWDVSETPRFAVLPSDCETSVALNPETGELSGYVSAHGDGARDDFKMYFYIKFDRPVNVEETWITKREGKRESGLTGSGRGVGINIAFDLPAGEELKAVLGTSYLSVELAKESTIREVGEKTFDEIKGATRAQWNELLSKIEITDTEERMKTFYSCFYRCFLYPRAFFEYDKNGKPVYYCTKDGSMKEGIMYTDNGFWDTYRSLFPLFTLLIPDKMKEMLEGFFNFYKDEGWLPKWLSPGERGMMPGTLIDAVLADAGVKGILTDEQMKLALDGMRKNAEESSGTPLHGRIGVQDYKEKGYVPCDKYHESVNNSLDAYYCDYCIARLAEKMGLSELAEKYDARSKNYRLLYDESVGFIHGRKDDGSWKENVSPFSWGSEYCEGGAWQNGFSVFHDVEGLAALYGGKEGFAAKLDELFATPPIYEIGTYYTEIHEMTEMARADFGQCAISNQPSFHVPYLYAMIGYPEKTAHWVNRMISEGFSSDAKGFPGDEDNGSMGAWYVFSVLGMYPVCPGDAEYVFGACSAEHAKVHLWNGNVLEIENRLNSGNDYQGLTVSVDGSKDAVQKISHEELLKANVITFYQK